MANSGEINKHSSGDQVQSATGTTNCATSNKKGHEDHLKLYMYFQDRADNVKEAMFKTLTWSIGFAAALLGFIFVKLTDFEPKKASLPLPSLLVIIALAGIAICVYSFLILFESGKHIRNNWDNADKFLVQIPDLAKIVKGKFVKGKFQEAKLIDKTLEPAKDEKETSIWRQLPKVPSMLLQLFLKVMPIWRQLFIVVVMFTFAFGCLLTYGVRLDPELSKILVSWWCRFTGCS